MFHRSQHVLRRSTGLAVPGASVTVKVTATGALPTLYATNDTSQPILNSAGSPTSTVITDENGHYAYYIANGVYDEVVSYGSITDTEPGIQMYDLSAPIVANVPVFTSVADGLAPASGGGIANFLRADGNWAPPPSTGGSPGTTANALTFTALGGAGPGTTFDGSVGRVIDYSTVGAAKTGAITASTLTMATARLLGRTSALTGAVEELSAAAVKAFLAITPGDLTLGVSTQAGANYTAVLADAAQYTRFTNAGAVTFTIPQNVFPVGAVIEFEQAGTGAVSVAAGAGVTINSRLGDVTLAGQYAVAALKCVANNVFVLTGDL